MRRAPIQAVNTAGVEAFVPSSSATGHHPVRFIGAVGEDVLMEIVGKYRHYKGGRYEVVGIARHSETEEELVVYLSPAGELWVRPREMFFEDVLVDGSPVARFARIG